MANARTRFDTIAEYLARQHEGKRDVVNGRPAVLVKQRPAVVYVNEQVAFRLHGRVLLQALTLKGSKPWHPFDQEPIPVEWALVPTDHFLRWDRLAIEALRCTRDGRRIADLNPAVDPPRREPPPAPQTTPKGLSERFAELMKAGKLKVFSFGLAPR